MGLLEKSFSQTLTPWLGSSPKSPRESRNYTPIQSKMQAFPDHERPRHQYENILP